MKYVAADIETTGRFPSWCQTIEIGAVVDDLANPRPVEELPKFHCYVVHDRYVGEPMALSFHAEIFRRIAEREPGFDYVEAKDVAEAKKLLQLTLSLGGGEVRVRAR